MLEDRQGMLGIAIYKVKAINICVAEVKNFLL